CAKTKIECNSDGLRRFDTNVAKLMGLGNSGRKFPENNDELKKFCDENEVYLVDIDIYKNKCMDGLSKQVTSVLIYSGKNAIKQFCRKSNSKVAELLRASKCANKGSAEINKCYTQLIDKLLGIQNTKDHKKKIPQVCCSYHNLLNECMPERLKRIDVCLPKILQTIIDFVNSIGGNALNLFCGEYNTDGSDKCQYLEAPPKKLKSQRRTKSFALPAIDVFQSIPKA
ncbi:uncharacterized protein LOC128953825, partial [Oppia nitens]|uniref:uncharacterized protein LOC128953825 n=1 Tax=Oppia nitens TaxID=1686743 RepID=UPI0023DAB438